MKEAIVDIVERISRVGDRIRRLREKRKLTQAGLAKVMRIAPSSISHYESGGRAITLETLFRLANALRVDVLTLFR